MTNLTRVLARPELVVDKKYPQYSELTDEILTEEALTFIGALEENFRETQEALLQKRELVKEALDKGQFPQFCNDSQVIEGNWKVAPTPSDLADRRVEITGPCERKMMINALNSGARVFMADLEDSMTPTWHNVLMGQKNLIEAVKGTLSFTSPEGKNYKLNLDTRLATLVVRPRGLHMVERHLTVAGKPASASLFDFGLYFFHNAKTLLQRGSGPYFYLPKLESREEARFWNDVFNFAQDYLKIERGTIRATVLIETILAAFEMEAILFELKEHAAGLNAGRWDYIFSLIKKTNKHKEFVLPDRSKVTMAVPFMRAYAKLLVDTCHKRGAHAIGGMAAFIPSRKDQAINEVALKKVQEDKEREASDGFDGTWVAHPDLVSTARAVFDKVLGAKPDQKEKTNNIKVSPQDLLNTAIEGEVTREGVQNNIDVALRYLDSWLSGNGAAAIHNLMEDAATAEIARAQLWQWIKYSTSVKSPHFIENMNKDIYLSIKNNLIDKLRETAPHIKEASEILDALVLSEQFEDFLTTRAYLYLQD